jgi:hypothetical protein
MVFFCPAEERPTGSQVLFRKSGLRLIIVLESPNTKRRSDADVNRGLLDEHTTYADPDR